MLAMMAGLACGAPVPERVQDLYVHECRAGVLRVWWSDTGDAVADWAARLAEWRRR